MNKYLWQSDTDGQIDETIMEFMAGEDVVLDRELFPFDIRATAAHVRGLERIDILNSDESATLCGLLDDLLKEFKAGDFILDERFEDGHSAIEVYLTGRAGELGARVHTGRSRNDQVAVATRLYMKECLHRATQAERRHRDVLSHAGRAARRCSHAGLYPSAAGGSFQRWTCGWVGSPKLLPTTWPFRHA